MKHLPLFAAWAVAMEGAAATPALLFHAPLDGSPVASVAAGNPAPLVAEGLQWGDGPSPGTRALRITRGPDGWARPRLAYAAAGNLPRESGTVAMWTRREWDFSVPDPPWRALFATPMPGDRDKSRIGSGALWFWWYGSKLRGDQSDAKDRYSVCDGIQPSGDWMHVAFSWRPGRVDLFVNGRRRRYLRDIDSPIRDALSEADASASVPDRSGIDRFFVGSIDGTDPADSLIADLRIYDTPLEDDEMAALFHEVSRPETAAPAPSVDWPALAASAAGRYERPAAPGEAPGTIAPEALELVADLQPADLLSDSDRFSAVGECRLVAAPPAAGGAPGEPPPPVVEAGPHEGDRFAVRLQLPPDRPLFLLEIDVPDDTLRTEDLIVQPCTGDGDYALQVGLLLGGEYPNSGAMLTHRCLFWARKSDVAVIATTAREGAPAAIAAIRAYAVRGVALPIASSARSAPSGEEAPPSRHAAIYYEDPALNLQMGLPQSGSATPVGFADELARLAAVMKFTGEDMLFYPGAWYQGLIESDGYNPRAHAPLWRTGVYETFDREGLGFVPTINLNNIPVPPGLVTIPSLSDGSLHDSPIAIHDTGKPNPGAWHNTPPNFNVFHPDVRREIERIFDVLVAEGAPHPSFGGVCLHLTQHCLLWWGSDRSGYNDYAVGAFCRDTGRDLPAGHPAAGARAEPPAPLRGRDYAEWLRSDPALWEAWIQWRCDQVTALYARLAAKLAAAHPGARLYVNNFVPPDAAHPDFGKPPFIRDAARRCGLDVPALEAAAPNIVVMQTDVPADPRWGYVERYFRFPDPALRDDAADRLRELAATPGFWALLGETSRPWANQHDRYWESAIGRNGDTMSCAWLQEHAWRVSTLNPGGGNALRAFTRPLRFHDTLGFSKGGFLVGTYGMEARLAPFALAFRALPPVLLPELPCSGELVKVRGGEYGDTNYLYAVNTGDAPADITLPLPSGAVELPSGEPAGSDRSEGAVRLAPNALRAFAWPGLRAGHAPLGTSPQSP